MTISVTISIYGIVASIMDMPARQSPEYNLAAPTVRVARPGSSFKTHKDSAMAKGS